jgi:outer membrane receptor for ferrienterochelin and colicins
LSVRSIRRPTPCWLLITLALACAASHAQTAAPAEPSPVPVPAPAPSPVPVPVPVPPSAAASAPAPPPAAQLKPVEVIGGRGDDTQQRRDSTAAKIVIGRDEIDRFGDSTLGDVLKRLPGVTLQGPPGRGGNIRMRGLGSGYTQILLDGQRVPPGFSLDSLTPEQIERIEILRAPTAETGARAIAGTINIITREGFTKRVNDVRLSLALENDRLQPSVSWTRNDALGALSWNYSLTAFSNDRQNDSVTTTVDTDPATGLATLDQRDTGEVREKRHGLHASGRLQWRSEDTAHTVTLMPLVIYSTGNTERSGTLEQSVGVGVLPAPYDTARTEGNGSFSLLRLNGQWNHRLGAGGRLEWKATFGQGRSRSASVRQETTGSALSRTLADDANTLDRNLLASGKLVKLLEGEHSLVAGFEAENNRRNERRATLETLPNLPPALIDFGDNVSASATRLAFFAQDEWTLTPLWSAHAGLRWEGINTKGSGASASASATAPATPTATNRSSVWTPLLHAVWKPTPDSRDQLRFSLTRSYRSPSLQNLIGSPRVNSRYPLNTSNTQTQPDYVGNPALKPELATGIDIAAERYVAGSGVFSANVFYRQIKDLMRGQTGATPETVSWSSQPRYVSRPQNVGDAVTQGLELEAKFRLSDLLANAPKIDLRANASVFRSRVKTVAPPDNRLDSQPDYTANFGADYRVPGVPLTLGGNLNWTPGYSTRQAATQTAYDGKKLGVDAYALWVFNPALQLRVTASNLAALDYVTGSALGSEVSTTTAPSYINLQLRLEIKL